MGPIIINLIAGVVILLILWGVGSLFLASSQITKDEAELREEGRPVLAVLVMANQELFRSRDPDMNVPALVALSFERPSPELLALLKDVGSRAFALYAGKPPGSDPERRVAALVKDDAHVYSRRRRVPPEFADGQEVYLADLVLYRKRLSPTAQADRAVPCLASGRAEGKLMQLEHDAFAAKKVFESIQSA